MTLKEMLGENYKDGMTVEEMLAFEVEEPKADNTDLEKTKRALNKANSEAAEYKRKLNERMSADEKAAAEQAENLAKMTEELNTLKREKTVSEHISKFVGIGYAPDLAKTAAEAMTDGDMGKVFECMGTFMADHDAKVTADFVKGNPAPVSGNVGSAAMTKEKFKEMSFDERNAYAKEHPDEYKSMYGQN